jgi:LDH2 family malate/lactate/ureidoglycolate dehydrogenase
MNPTPKIKVTSETTATVIVEGDRAPGVLSMTFAMNQAIEKARAAGIGLALVSHTTHSGPVGYYTQMAVRANMAGIAIMSSRPNMAYFGAKAAGVATNPIAIAVPGGPDDSVMLDMASSELALGKIKDALARGTALPEAGALTKDGVPTTDPTQAAIPMPLGGAKGSGLSLMFEALTSLMLGNPLLEPALEGRECGHSQNGLAIAINIGAFTDTEGYREQMSALSRALKGLPPMEYGKEILLPGEPENRRLNARRRTGIPLPDSIWSQLSAAAKTLGVPLPLST